MLRTLLAALLAIGLTTAITPASAKQLNPVLGNAKTALITKDDAKAVTAKGYQAAAWLYYGLVYSSYAQQNAAYAQFNNWYYGVAYGAYDAYLWSYEAGNAYYQAYLWGAG